MAVPKHPIGLIDLRSSADFFDKHIKNSCSLPWERLPKSMHELPAKHQPVSLIGRAEQLTEASTFLQSKGYEIIEQFLANDSFWHHANTQHQVVAGCDSLPLWRENPLLSEVIDRVEQQVIGRTAIDVACGAGRDSVYLAKRGWQVTAIDHKADTLERGQQLAKSSATRITTLLRDLETQKQPFSGLSADLILVMRYLHRPLLAELDKVIKPGGAIIYSTFMRGSEKFGSPRNPNYLLKPGELSATFSRYHILIDQQRELEDGRPVALFVALKTR